MFPGTLYHSAPEERQTEGAYRRPEKILTEALREHHVDRLKQHKCSAKNGMIYLDLLTNLERIGDHAENIATSVEKQQAIHHVA